MYIRYLLFWL